ncbi:MAG: adenosylcobinamide amidohydrolase [Anaerolineaceae bacterium]
MNDFSALGLSISATPQAIHVCSAAPFTVLSSAVIGGGFHRVRHILNMHVDKDYYNDNPAVDLRAMAHQLGINESFVGLMTAVYIRKARSAVCERNGIKAGVILTAGITNATCAGITPPFLPGPGTINIMAFLNVRLSRAAMVNAVSTVTEAKCATLAELGIQTPQGDPATGTSTDTVTVACPGVGAFQSYAGPVSLPGWLLACAVRTALNDALTQEEM